jgi:hypothetical protein
VVLPFVLRLHLPVWVLLLPLLLLLVVLLLPLL